MEPIVIALHHQDSPHVVSYDGISFTNKFCFVSRLQVILQTRTTNGSVFSLPIRSAQQQQQLLEMIDW